MEALFEIIWFQTSISDLTICITKNGYKPYICRLYSNRYIQHEVLDYDNEIQANRVEIGHNVINDKPEGPVVIDKGSTIIKSKEDVFIKNSFQVNRGASFYVK